MELKGYGIKNRIDGSHINDYNNWLKCNKIIPKIIAKIIIDVDVSNTDENDWMFQKKNRRFSYTLTSFISGQSIVCDKW